MRKSPTSVAKPFSWGSMLYHPMVSRFIFTHAWYPFWFLPMTMYTSFGVYPAERRSEQRSMEKSSQSPVFRVTVSFANCQYSRVPWMSWSCLYWILFPTQSRSAIQSFIFRSESSFTMSFLRVIMLGSLGVTNSLTCSGLSLNVRGTSAPNANE